MTGCPSWSYFYPCKKSINLQELYILVEENHLHLRFGEENEPLNPYEYCALQWNAKFASI